MLLCTVPACQGMFAFCDGTRYTFWTESKYTLITGQSAPTSALLLMPAGQHMAAIAVFPFCETEAQKENPIFNLPKQFAASVIDLQPGTVTEIIAARKNIKKVLDYHIIVH